MPKSKGRLRKATPASRMKRTARKKVGSVKMENMLSFTLREKKSNQTLKISKATVKDPYLSRFP